MARRSPTRSPESGLPTAEADILWAGAQDLGVELGSEALERIGRFLGLLALWNGRFRLTGDRELQVIARKHVVDSLAPVPYLPTKGLIVDIGTGAGFPGIVLGCVRPDLPLVLIESRRRPTSFLREAVRSIPLPRTQVLELRAATAAHEPNLSHRVKLVIARGVQPRIFFGAAAALLATDGMAIAMQTPRSARTAVEIARPYGLRLAGTRDYRLPDGSQRSLLLLSPFMAAEAVSSRRRLC